jgi:hypothetical protein
MFRLVAPLALGLFCLACGGAEARPAPGRPAPVEDFSAEAPSEAADTEPAAPQPAGDRDGPHISRSIGEEGGVVVFWPRVIPRTEDAALNALAGRLQKELAALAKEAFPGKPIDVRPEPERVCPRDGCAAMTVGAVLAHVGGGCVVAAVVSESGKAPQRIVPWVGRFDVKREEVPFREHPESEITIRDAMPCGDVGKSFGEKKADVVAQLRKAGG